MGLPGGEVTCAWLSRNQWDTAFFGVPMGTLGLEGPLNEDALRLLLPVALEEAAALGLEHLRTSQRAHTPEGIGILQEYGFRVRWSSVQIAYDTRQAGRPPRHKEPLRFEECGPEHLPALLSLARKLEPYNWLEFERALPQAARDRYLTQRIENCVLTDYADRAVVAIWRDRPIGLHASSTVAHSCVPGRPFAYVRETFIGPGAPLGLGQQLLRAAVTGLAPDIRVVTGRVRINGHAMLSAALSVGYTIVSDEVLLTR